MADKLAEKTIDFIRELLPQFQDEENSRSVTTFTKSEDEQIYVVIHVTKSAQEAVCISKVAQEIAWSSGGK